jgi:hypothetical protein
VLRRVSSETWIGPSQRKKINISLARLALRRGDYAAAHTYINQVPEVDVPGSQSGYYWEVRGNLAFLEHNYPEARRLYELGLTSTGSGDEVLFQTGLARTALAAHDSSQYAQMRTNLDRLWQTPQGKFFLSLGLLDGALAGRLHENAALEKIAQEVLTTQATIGEMRALTYADHEQFQQAMKAAGYNQLLEQINKKYGWS